MLTAELIEPADTRWTELLSDVKHDVYQLPEYVSFAAQWQEAGTPVAFVATEGKRKLLIPLIVRGVPAELAQRDDLYDATSPRGFAGPVFGGAVGNELGDFAGRAFQAFVECASARGIVSAFVRLHPLLPPPMDVMRRFGAVHDHGDSVSIDLTLSWDELWRQTRKNHQRDIRQAERLGYAARIDEPWERLDDFAAIYAESMQRLGAEPFWRLPREYFHAFRDRLGRHAHLCVAERDGALASGALLTEADGFVEYHLAGTSNEHLAASPSKLLIDYARRWAKQRGNRVLHLAGTPRRGDSLSQFKAGFSPLLHPIYSWRVVADPSAYETLVTRWEAVNGVRAHVPDAYFPIYRSASPDSRSPANPDP